MDTEPVEPVGSGERLFWLELDDVPNVWEGVPFPLGVELGVDDVLDVVLVLEPSFRGGGEDELEAELEREVELEVELEEVVELAVELDDEAAVEELEVELSWRLASRTTAVAFSPAVDTPC